jgi:N utilization substance protein B
MINRVLIRLKVLQIVYAYYQKGDLDVHGAEKELLRSLQKLYDLYHYLLLLITELTDRTQKQEDTQKYKYLLSNAVIGAHSRFINNRFAEQLHKNVALQHFANKNGYLWDDDDQIFLRSLLDKILQSAVYQEYIKSPDNYESDRNFWRHVFEKVILEDGEDMDDVLEAKCLFWNDDWTIVLTFVLKTIKKFNENSPVTLPLLPMFAKEEDRDFALQLLRFTCADKQANDALIAKYSKNWDIRRVSKLDMCVMQIALAEIRNFPMIPINVSLNEYVELVHYYSTPNSSPFINGILDAIATELREDGTVFKS